MYSRFSAAVRFALPPKKFDLERLSSYHAFQRGNLRFVLSQKISSSGVIFKGPRFVLGHPDADQIAGEIVTLRQRMQRLACNVFLSDLTLEFDAVGVVLGHGFHPWKARRPRSIPNPRPVHRQGRTPKADIERPDCHARFVPKAEQVALLLDHFVASRKIAASSALLMHRMHRQ